MNFIKSNKNYQFVLDINNELKVKKCEKQIVNGINYRMRITQDELECESIIYQDFNAHTKLVNQEQDTCFLLDLNENGALLYKAIIFILLLLHV